MPRVPPTRNRPSLYRRLAVAMSVFGVAVGFVFAASTLATLFWTEDEVLSRLAELEADRLLANGNVEPASSATSENSRFRLYRAHELPAALARRVGSHPDGTYEVELGDRELFVVVRSKPSGEPSYLAFDITGLEPNDGPFGTRVVLICLFVSLLIALAAAVLGIVLARRVSRPLQELVRSIECDAPSPLSVRLRSHDCDSEIQSLVDSLTASVEAIEGFRDREQRFTRYASHELRTPVATIQGASELLRSKPADVTKLLDRIDRGVESMNSLIDTFLWLARAPENEVLESQSIRASIARVLRAHERAATLRKVKVSVRAEGDPTVPAPSTVLDVAIGNLVANAIAFSANATITIRADASKLVVFDSGRGMSEQQLVSSLADFSRTDDSPGHGLGLPIVNAICERLDWRLTIESEVGKGTRAKLAFAAGSRMDDG